MNRWKTVVWILRILSMLLLCIQVAQAAAGVSYNEGVYRIPLAWFMKQPGVVRLVGHAAVYHFSLAVPEHMAITSAELDLHYLNSVNEIAARSQLQVRLDGTTLTTVRLNGDRPSGRIRVILPTADLTPGYHRLSVAVAQHYHMVCEDGNTPELWTQINPVSSVLELTAAPRALRPHLDDLNGLFDPRRWQSAFGLTVLVPEVNGAMQAAIHSDVTHPSPVDGNLMIAAASVVQGAALRLRYRGLRVHYQPVSPADPMDDTPNRRQFPGLTSPELYNEDAALIGTAGQLRAILSPVIAARITGPFIGVYAQDNDSARFILVISGKNIQQVDEAARAFAENRLIWPHSSWARIHEIQEASLPTYTNTRWLRGRHEYAFSELGFKARTFRGSNSQPDDLTFWLPPDMFAGRGDKIKLYLHLAYGGGLTPTSVLNVDLNGHFEQAIVLSDSRGGVDYDYRIEMPMSSLRPGRNVFEFLPHLLPLSTGKNHCTVPSADSLALRVFADSRIQVPAYAAYAELPDLKLLNRGGFPFANPSPDRVHPLAIWVSGHSSANYAAALTLLGRLAQSAGVALHGLHFVHAPPGDDENLLVVGTTETLPISIRKAVPLHVRARGVIFLSTVLTQPLGEDTPAWWARWGNRILGSHPWEEGLLTRPAQKRYRAGFALNPGLGTAILSEFESPWRSGQTVLLLTAPDGKTLTEAADQLSHGSFWGALRGDTAWWRPEHSNGIPRTAKLADTYTLGAIDKPGFVAFYFSGHPWLWTTIVFGGLLFLTAGVWLFMRRRRHRWKREEDE